MVRNVVSLPNLLTLGRLCLSPWVLSAMIDHQYMRALGLFSLASLTDVCDGWLARVLHQKSTLGRYLDPIADKFLMMCVWIGCVLLGWISPLLGGLLIVRDVLVVVGSLSLHASPRFHVHPLRAGKVNTTIQMVFVIFALWYHQAPHPTMALWWHVGLGGVVLSALYSGGVYAMVWYRHRHRVRSF